MIKELPKTNFHLHGQIIKPSNKNIFYLGTSKSISENRKDIYNTKYAIGHLISNSTSAKIYKIGITKNIKTRLSYYHKEITDFEIIKFWKIKNPEVLEKILLENHYKSGFSSYGIEWFWDTSENNKKLTDLIEEIEWYIENSYIKTQKGYKYLFK